MAANKPGKAEILAAFFDDGTYSPLFTDGAVSAAYGCANGQNAYVVFEDGSPVGVQDIEKNIRVLEMAAETGAPVVTFYDSTGAKLEGGLDLLNANARLTAEIARVSGVVPQVAVVTGTCAGTNAINAAAADVCVMAEDAELFLNAPFNAEDKVANAGSAAFAAKAGVAADTVVWAKELARYGIRVAGVAPGFIETEMVASMKPDALERMCSGIPLKRMGKPAEIAHSVAYILENDYYTGRILELDGGLRL